MSLTADAAWQACLAIVRDNISKQSYQTWFVPTRALELKYENDLVKLTVQLPSGFYYDYVDSQFGALLKTAVTRVLGENGRLYYKVLIAGGEESDAAMGLPARVESLDPRTVQPPPAPSGMSVQTTRPVHQQASNLHPHYTFSNFIEGSCNSLARSAADAIARNPGGTPYNPLFVYGGVGLGKTHLIQAIGNHVQAYRYPKSVLYVSSEAFTNDFIRAIRENKAREFSYQYRKIDVLIIDDVQFFGGKEKTQEEFFHIFNTLHQVGNQIVLAADRPAHEIKGIEERLISRFRWGLIVDLQPPELETRIAILNRKARDSGVEFSPEVIDYIAHHVKSNIRELEGALIRLLAQSTLRNEDVTPLMAREALRDLIKETHVNLTIDVIQQVVCSSLSMDQELILGKSKKREIVHVRHLAMYFSKEFTQHALQTIGNHFGGRDHSTVIHALKSVNNEIDTNANYRTMVEDIRHKIKQVSP